jgi:hypothetical protein
MVALFLTNIKANRQGTVDCSRNKYISKAAETNITAQATQQGISAQDSTG